VSVRRSQKLVTLGRVSGVFGVKGWLKIESYTDPPANIGRYARWTLRLRGNERQAAVEDARAHGPKVVAKLAGFDDRDRAADWIGAEIVVERSELPPLDAGEFYWTDLEGLHVRTPDGISLGTVDHLMATGGNDVLVLRGTPERLVPFVLGDVIKRVDLEQGVIEADWPVDF
jgi:16S rRNA processing protein RimM